MQQPPCHPQSNGHCTYSNTLPSAIAAAFASPSALLSLIQLARTIHLAGLAHPAESPLACLLFALDCLSLVRAQTQRSLPPFGSPACPKRDQIYYSWLQYASRLYSVSSTTASASSHSKPPPLTLMPFDEFSLAIQPADVWDENVASNVSHACLVALHKLASNPAVEDSFSAPHTPNTSSSSYTLDDISADFTPFDQDVLTSVSNILQTDLTESSSSASSSPLPPLSSPIHPSVSLVLNHYCSKLDPPHISLAQRPHTSYSSSPRSATSSLVRPSTASSTMSVSSVSNASKSILQKDRKLQNIFERRFLSPNTALKRPSTAPTHMTSNLPNVGRFTRVESSNKSPLTQQHSSQEANIQTTEELSNNPATPSSLTSSPVLHRVTSLEAVQEGVDWIKYPASAVSDDGLSELEPIMTSNAKKNSNCNVASNSNSNHSSEPSSPQRGQLPQSSYVPGRRSIEVSSFSSTTSSRLYNGAPSIDSEKGLLPSSPASKLARRSSLEREDNSPLARVTSLSRTRFTHAPPPLPAGASMEDTEDRARIESTLQLSPATRRALVRRSRKLQAVLGAPVDETAALRTLQTTTNEFRHSVDYPPSIRSAMFLPATPTTPTSFISRKSSASSMCSDENDSSKDEQQSPQQQGEQFQGEQKPDQQLPDQMTSSTKQSKPRRERSARSPSSKEKPNLKIDIYPQKIPGSSAGDAMDEDVRERETRRRKLAKVRNFLGERVPAHYVLGGAEDELVQLAQTPSTAKRSSYHEKKNRKQSSRPPRSKSISNNFSGSDSNLDNERHKTPTTRQVRRKRSSKLMKTSTRSAAAPGHRGTHLPPAVAYDDSDIPEAKLTFKSRLHSLRVLGRNVSLSNLVSAARAADDCADDEDEAVFRFGRNTGSQNIKTGTRNVSDSNNKDECQLSSSAPPRSPIYPVVNDVQPGIEMIRRARKLEQLFGVLPPQKFYISNKFMERADDMGDEDDDDYDRDSKGYYDSESHAADGDRSGLETTDDEKPSRPSIATDGTNEDSDQPIFGTPDIDLLAAPSMAKTATGTSFSSIKTSRSAEERRRSIAALSYIAAHVPEALEDLAKIYHSDSGGNKVTSSNPQSPMSVASTSGMTSTSPLSSAASAVLTFPLDSTTTDSLNGATSDDIVEFVDHDNPEHNREMTGGKKSRHPVFKSTSSNVPSALSSPRASGEGRPSLSSEDHRRRYSRAAKLAHVFGTTNAVFAAVLADIEADCKDDTEQSQEEKDEMLAAIHRLKQIRI